MNPAAGETETGRAVAEHRRPWKKYTFGNFPLIFPAALREKFRDLRILAIPGERC